jgi:DNA adenine methylase
MYPFLQWVGGKRRIIPYIKYPKFTRYVEPFVGGGAVLFDILTKRLAKEVYINDLNTDLINLYRVVRDNVSPLIRTLNTLERGFVKSGYSDAYYYEQRNLYNHPLTDDPVAKSARLIFLNKAGFNGLYRVNKQGELNTAVGSSSRRMSITDKLNLREVSKALEYVSIINNDYISMGDWINKDTFVYLDPPYQGTYDRYTSQGFNTQEQLVKFLRLIVNRGASFVISNVDTPEIRKIYKRYYIETVGINHTVGVKMGSRNKVTELLVYGGR